MFQSKLLLAHLRNYEPHDILLPLHHHSLCLRRGLMEGLLWLEELKQNVDVHQIVLVRFPHDELHEAELVTQIHGAIEPPENVEILPL